MSKYLMAIDAGTGDVYKRQPQMLKPKSCQATPMMMEVRPTMEPA